jgi:hypothetical protein
MNPDKPNSKNEPSPLDQQKSIRVAWEKILSRFPKKLQEEFRIERPNPDQDDIEMFKSLYLLKDEPVEVSVEKLLETNEDVIYRTPPDVFDEINDNYYKPPKVKLDKKKCHNHETKPERLREYSKMPAETAEPSVLLDEEIWFGTGRFVAALLRGDKSLRVWKLSRKPIILLQK